MAVGPNRQESIESFYLTHPIDLIISDDGCNIGIESPN
jgi:hypothetical protein